MESYDVSKHTYMNISHRPLRGLELILVSLAKYVGEAVKEKSDRSVYCMLQMSARPQSENRVSYYSKTSMMNGERLLLSAFQVQRDSQADTYKERLSAMVVLGCNGHGAP